MIPFKEAVKVWARVAALSFGGPAGQIAVMHRILVDEKRWISETRFLHALNYCMLLPGPEAQQLATYLGWLLHKTRGGLLAGGLFVLPGFLAILLLSTLYALFREVTWVTALFYGIKPAVLAIVVGAVMKIGRRALKTRVMLCIAIAAFTGIFLLGVPFPALVVAAGVIGWAGGWLHARGFGASSDDPAQPADPDPVPLNPATPHAGRAVVRAAFWLFLWFAPIVGLVWFVGRDHIFVHETLFFSKVAVVTFGGAYAVLAYIAQQAVETYGWLQPGEMLDGLGMAETTPGPLIMVVQFVAFMGAYRFPGTLDPLMAGVIGSVLVTWVTFIPCFLFVLVGAPFMEALRGNRHLTAALSGITAAVVGVIANLGIWFALNTWFAELHAREFSVMSVLVPQWHSLDAVALGLSILAVVIHLVLKAGIFRTMGACVLVAMIYQYLFVGS